MIIEYDMTICDPRVISEALTLSDFCQPGEGV